MPSSQLFKVISEPAQPTAGDITNTSGRGLIKILSSKNRSQLVAIFFACILYVPELVIVPKQIGAPEGSPCTSFPNGRLFSQS